MGITNYLKRAIEPLYKKVRYTESRMVYTYAKYYNQLPIKKQTIFYESRDGQNMGDSPLAIFEYHLKKDKEKKYYHVWSYVESPELSQLMANYKQLDNVLFIKRNSKKYLQWLCQAEYIISNATLPFYFTRKKEQKYINTWHGTPLKKMGFDMKSQPDGPKNIVRNFLNATHLLSPNQHTTDMYRDSFRLDSMFQGEILESGYPRIDYTLNVDKVKMLNVLKMFGIEIDESKQIVLYAPTWKGETINQARNDIEQIYAELTQLKKEHGAKYNFFVKIHPFIYKEAKKFQPINEMLLPDAIDTNQLLGITDILMTDYSSIFFDFLVTDRPILFFCWDDDLYSSTRGKYFSNEELPGPVSYTIEELSHALENTSQEHLNYQANYLTFKKKFVPHDDGCATERYVAYIFDNIPNHKITPIKIETNKKKLLFYPGGMRNNGITSSFLNLVGNLDYQHYEVTCLMDVPKIPEQFANIAKLPEGIHLIYRFSAPIYTLKESYQDLWFHTFGVTNKSERFYPQQAYKKEISRLIGADTSYDVAIDFSGYSLFWAKLILAAPAPKKLCYLHSDMIADRERSVNGKLVHKMNLNGLFSVYKWFDQLVSVSQLTKEINAQHLSMYAKKESFTYAQNTIDIAKIRQTQPQVINLADVEQESIKLISKMGHFNETQTQHISYWNINPNLDASRQSIYLLTGKELVSTVSIIASTTKKEKCYYKIRVNNCYFGWVEAETLVLNEDSILSESQVMITGRINPAKISNIYNMPFNLPGCKIVSESSEYKPLYMTVKKRVQTTQGNYLQLRVKGVELGWLNEENFLRSTLVNTTKPVFKQLLPFLMRVSSQLKNKQLVKHFPNRIRETVELNQYGKLNSENVKTWKSSTANCEVNDMKLTKNELVFISKLERRQSDGYVQIKTSQNVSGWVNKNQVTLLEKAEVYSFSTNYQEYVVVKGATSINLYSDCLLTSEQATSDKMYWHVKETKKLTNGRTVLRVEDDEAQIKGWLDQAEISVSSEHGTFNTSGKYTAYPKQEEVSFVTLGRLSPEKQQLKLIQAFKKYYDTHQKGSLYIIGDGSLYQELEMEIVKLHLENQIILVGQVDNPFAFLSRCSVFVLTSEYEGQPMVLLEAMTLGMPIISTDIPSCRFVLEDGKYGLLTKTNDVTGITDAMIELTMTSPSFANFDYVAYNKVAITDFYWNLGYFPEIETI